MVDQGNLDDALDNKKLSNSSTDRVSSEELENLPSMPIAISQDYIDGAFVKRAGEEIMRIWIAPFEDKSGAFQGESFVHTVIKPGRWVTSDASFWIPPEVEV